MLITGASFTASTVTLKLVLSLRAPSDTCTVMLPAPLKLACGATVKVVPLMLAPSSVVAEVIL